jgi:hypothetical protein
MTYSKQCEVCGKSFDKPYHLSVSNWNKTKYCSISCSGKSKTSRIVGNCAYCSTKIERTPSVNSKYNRKFCSAKCYHLYRAELLPKEEQPRFGSGFSIQERQHRKKARSILNHYLRDKKIPRPPCEICGEPMAEAHHEDYNKPLDVKWFCFKHHRQTHGQPRTLNPR